MGAQVRKPSAPGGKAERVKPPMGDARAPFKGPCAHSPAPSSTGGHRSMKPGGVPAASPCTVISDVQPAGL